MATFSGVQALVAAKTDNTVAFSDAEQTQSFEVSFEGNLQNIYQLGARETQEIKEGTIEIEGSFTRYFEGGNFSAMATTLILACQGSPQTEYWVAIFPEGDAAPKILISNCKMGPWTLGVDGVNGMTTVTIAFKGLAIAVT